ncbi:hypothetical protein O9992_30725 [Vibrio lentus]|nr:hypothetical protein [Vibrio lentus]
MRFPWTTDNDLNAQELVRSSNQLAQDPSINLADYDGRRSLRT